MDDDLEVPFKDVLENELPEVYEYIKNAVRTLQRQQNLLTKIKNNGPIDFKVTICLVCYHSFCFTRGLHLNVVDSVLAAC